MGLATQIYFTTFIGRYRSARARPESRRRASVATSASPSRAEGAEGDEPEGERRTAGRAAACFITNPYRAAHSPARGAARADVTGRRVHARVSRARRVIRDFLVSHRGPALSALFSRRKCWPALGARLAPRLGASRNLSTASLQHVKLDVTESGVAMLRLDCQGEKQNTLSRELMDEMEVVVKQVETDPKVKAVVLISDKQGSFIAGANIKMVEELGKKDASAAGDASAEGQVAMDKIASMQKTKPWVAAIDGPASAAARGRARVLAARRRRRRRRRRAARGDARPPAGRRRDAAAAEAGGRGAGARHDADGEDDQGGAREEDGARRPRRRRERARAPAVATALDLAAGKAKAKQRKKGG